MRLFPAHTKYHYCSLSDSFRRKILYFPELILLLQVYTLTLHNLSLLNVSHHTSSGISPLYRGDPCWGNQIRKHYDQHEGLHGCWTGTAANTIILGSSQEHTCVNSNSTEVLILC